MIISAIDVGFAATGHAELELTEAGWQVRSSRAILTCSEVKRRHLHVADDDARRMTELALELGAAISYSSAAVVELPSGGAKSARALRAMALASGAVIAVVAGKRIPVEWFTPRQTRIAGGGAACASKEHVIRGVEKRFPGYGANCRSRVELEAVADALATFMAAEREGNIIKMASRL